MKGINGMHSTSSSKTAQLTESHEDLFQQGVAARRAEGTEFGEYDLVLRGLSTILDAAGVETLDRDMDYELAGRFHNPLAMASVDDGVDAIVGEMARVMRTARPSPDAQRALEGALIRPFTASVDDAHLDERIDQLSASIDGGEQARRIQGAHMWAVDIKRRLLLIEALGGDVSSLQELAEQADRVQAAALRLMQRCKERLAALEARRAALPCDRARSMKPLAKLRTSVTVGWSGTVTEAGADIITDGRSLYRADALYAARRRDLTERVTDTIRSGELAPRSAQAAREVWLEQMEAPAHDVVIGWHDEEDRVDQYIVGYVLGVETEDIHYVDAQRAACVERWTLKSLGPLTAQVNENGHVLYCRGGEPVALIAGLARVKRYRPCDIDVALARQTLQAAEGHEGYGRT
jgi:hypothetical protein